MAPDATLVAHNLAYDWGVIAETASELGLKGGDAFRSLQAMPRFCTCVNEQTKRDRTAYFFKRLNTWIGPKLGALAAGPHVPSPRVNKAPPTPWSTAAGQGRNERTRGVSRSVVVGTSPHSSSVALEPETELAPLGLTSRSRPCERAVMLPK